MAVPTQKRVCCPDAGGRASNEMCGNCAHLELATGRETSDLLRVQPDLLIWSEAMIGVEIITLPWTGSCRSLQRASSDCTTHRQLKRQELDVRNVSNGPIVLKKSALERRSIKTDRGGKRAFALIPPGAALPAASALAMSRAPSWIERRILRAGVVRPALRL